jgi:hypothetical protein
VGAIKPYSACKWVGHLDREFPPNEPTKGEVGDGLPYRIAVEIGWEDTDPMVSWIFVRVLQPQKETGHAESRLLTLYRTTLFAVVLFPHPLTLDIAGATLQESERNLAQPLDLSRPQEP